MFKQNEGLIIPSGSIKTVKELIYMLINDAITVTPVEASHKTISLTPVINSLPSNGKIYEIMDEVCKEMTSAEWHVYYRHYYTFVSTCYITFSRNKLPEIDNSEFKYFVPYAEEHKHYNSFYPSHPERK